MPRIAAPQGAGAGIKGEVPPGQAAVLAEIPPAAGMQAIGRQGPDPIFTRKKPFLALIYP